MDSSVKARKILLHSKMGERASRVLWIDYAKGYGIVLVVFGHALRALVTAGISVPTPTLKFIDSWIYSFHMPLFFFLSGLFLQRAAERGVYGLISDKCRTIVYPYLVWSTLTLLIKTALGDLVSYQRHIQELPLILVEPIEQYWFLYALLLASLTIGLLLTTGVKPWLILLGTVLLYPDVFPLPRSNWAPFEDARHFAIYVALGMATKSLLSSEAKVRISELVAAGAIGFLVTVSFAAAPIFWGRDIAMPLIACSGILSIVAVSVLNSRVSSPQIINFVGQFSLEIYLAHTIASAGARIVLVKIMGIAYPIVHVFVDTLAGVIFPIGLALLLRRFNFRWGFTIPKRDVVNVNEPTFP